MTTATTTTFTDLAAAFAALPACTFGFGRKATEPVAHKHHRVWYVTYIERHETPAQKWERQLAQGPQRSDAAPCWRCGQLATTDLCVFCAIDTVVA